MSSSTRTWRTGGMGMNRLGATTAACTLAALGLVTLPGGAAAQVQWFDINPDVSDNSDADGSAGGRVEGIDCNPGDNQTCYVASEYGGVFKTFDSGASWTHLTRHLPRQGKDVLVDPTNPNRVYATSLWDKRNPMDTESGIQVSNDGGISWSHPATATPPGGFSCINPSQQPAAYGIEVFPGAEQNVYVGTNCGLAISGNSGATWNHTDVVANGTGTADTVWDVVVQPGGPMGMGIIDVCGNDRHRRSVDGGMNWTGGSADLPAGRCSIAVSPDESYVLFVYASDNNIYESDDGGQNWTLLGTPDSRRQGRVPFVAVNDRSGNGGRNFDLWAGDVRLFRGGCTTPATPAMGGANRCPTANTGAPGPPPAGWAGPFTRTNGAHDDVSDIHFDETANVDACPTLFGSDGGMHVNTDNGAGCQNPSWQRSNTGLHAHWLWSMDGADAPGATNEFLYYGVQDSGAWGTSDAGANPPTWTDPDCCDIMTVVAEAARVVYDTCCQILPSGAFQSTLVVRNPGMTGGGAKNPLPPGTWPQFMFPSGLANFTDKQYAAITGGAMGGVWITNDITAGPITWNALGATTVPPITGNKGGIWASVPDVGPPVFFIHTNARPGTAAQMWKYIGTGGGTWTRIDNNPGAPGLFLPVFAVHEKNPNLLYAADGNGNMLRSFDGGLNWESDPALDAIMTASGFFATRSPTLIAFNPEDPNMLVAGGDESGVFLSSNGGMSWSLISDPFTPADSGIPHIPEPRFAYFDYEGGDLEAVYIGTRGRGVWRAVLPVADLFIEKSDDKNVVHAGEELFYTILVGNDGPDDATNVTVTDILPDGVTYLADTGGCDASALPALICDIGDLAAGEEVEFEIKVLVPSDAVVDEDDGTMVITNVASVSGAVQDPDPTNNTDEESTFVEDWADLVVTKLCKPDRELLAGEIGSCTVIVDNFGPSDSRDVVVMDALVSDGSFTIVGTPTASQGTCTAFATTYACMLGDLEAASPSQSGRATLEVLLTATEQVDINDLARVIAATPDPDITNNESRGSIAVEAVADLSLSKSDSPDPVVAGETLTYTLDLDNGGPSTAVNVVVQDVIPAGVTIDSVSGSGGASCIAGEPGDPLQPTTCDFGTLAPLASRSMTIVVTVLPDVSGIIHNDSRVFSDTLDVDNSNDLAGADTTVEIDADLSVTKEDFPDPVLAGENVTYEVTISNEGPSRAVDVALTDNLPAETTFVQATISNGTGTCVPLEVPPNRVVCDLNDLDPGEFVKVFIEAAVSPSVPDSTVITNDASVSAATPDGNSANDSASEDTLVNAEADLVAFKDSNFEAGNPSGTIIWKLNVTNAGPSDAQDVVVVDTLPLSPDTKKIVFEFDSSGVCVLDASINVLTCPFGTLPSGEQIDFEIHISTKGRVDVITNTMEVSSSTTDPDTSNNISTKDVIVQGSTGDPGGPGGGRGH
jgi:uncharacterized repeat protein (TIGR01451 family)